MLFLVGLACAATAAADHPGLAVYREHCLRCHGENGAGTADVPAPLAGDRSVNQLAKYVHDTMPEDDPEAVTGDAARRVAEYIHGAFYSAVARDRQRAGAARGAACTWCVAGHVCSLGAATVCVGGLRGTLARERRSDVLPAPPNSRVSAA